MINKTTLQVNTGIRRCAIYTCKSCLTQDDDLYKRDKLRKLNK